MKRRSLVASGGALALSALLPGCGSSSGSGSGQLRLLNASVGYPTVGMTVDATTVAPVAYGAASAYATYNAGSITTAVTDGSSGTVIQSQSRSVQSGVNYTLVAYGWTTGVKTYQLSDGEAAPASGYAKFRVLNLAGDAGALTVYVTAETADLASAAPTIASAAADTVSGYATVTAGTYRVRVTGLGNTDDLRFDVSGVNLPSAGILTLMITPGSGGVLVQGLLVAQGGAVTTLAGTKSRVRVVASVANNASVTATVGNTAIFNNAISPNIGSYVTLTAGSLPVTVTVNGVAVPVANLAAVAGGDYTLLVDGTPSAPAVTLITDVNRLPLIASNAKVRLVHGASALASSGMSMTVNYTSAATNVAFGTASNYAEMASGTNVLVEVTNPLALSTVYSNSTAILVAGGLYTLFVLMGTNGPVGVLRRER